MCVNTSAFRLRLRASPLALILLLTLRGIAAGQAPATPTLDALVRQLQDNAWDYRTNVPDFFADEHVVSSMKQEGAREVKTTSDSIFRLVRSHGIGETHNLTESREIKLVNKKPATSSNLQGPAVFTGGFSTAPIIVSLEMSHCFDYALEEPTPLDKQRMPPDRQRMLLISYTITDEGLHDESCPGPEKQSGRVFVDPETLRLVRFEMVLPNHKDVINGRMLWRWSVDFAPVTLDNHQFWLPKTITSHSEANNGAGVWEFTATYSNYHKTEVRSRILTESEPTALPK